MKRCPAVGCDGAILVDMSGMGSRCFGRIDYRVCDGKNDRICFISKLAWRYTYKHIQWSGHGNLGREEAGNQKLKCVNFNSVSYLFNLLISFRLEEPICHCQKTVTTTTEVALGPLEREQSIYIDIQQLRRPRMKGLGPANSAMQ